MSDSPARVSAEEAKRLVDEEGYVYVDVRSEGEYAGGHPVGARNVPFMNAGAGGMKPNDKFVAVMNALFDKNAKLVVGCQSGKRSMRAIQALEQVGFDSLVDVRPGFGGVKNAFGQVTEPGWSGSGLPVETTTDGGSYTEQLAETGVAS